MRKCRILQFIDTNSGRLYYCSSCKKYLPKDDFCFCKIRAYRDCLSDRCRSCAKRNSLNGKCAISNIPMTYEFCKGNVMTNISVDQINPKAGYTKDNVQLVCWAVNRMKGEMSMDELLYFVNSIHDNLME